MISWLSELSRSSVCCLSASEHELLLNFSDIWFLCFGGSCTSELLLSVGCSIKGLGGFRLDLMSAGGQFSGKTDRVFFLMGPPPGFFKD